VRRAAALGFSQCVCSQSAEKAKLITHAMTPNSCSTRSHTSSLLLSPTSPLSRVATMIAAAAAADAAPAETAAAAVIFSAGAIVLIWVNVQPTAVALGSLGAPGVPVGQDMCPGCRHLSWAHLLAAMPAS
jgi:hypothetical protein